MEYILDFLIILSKYLANFSSLCPNLIISVFRGANYRSISIFKNIFRFNTLRCSTILNFIQIEQLLLLNPTRVQISRRFLGTFEVPTSAMLELLKTRDRKVTTLVNIVSPSVLSVSVIINT